MIKQATAHRPTNEVTQARTAARRAYAAARAAGGITALTASRYWAETLTLLEGKTRGTQAEMLDRTRYLLELIVDRESWPR